MIKMNEYDHTKHGCNEFAPAREAVSSGVGGGQLNYERRQKTIDRIVATNGQPTRLFTQRKSIEL